MTTLETPSEMILSYKPRILLDSINKKVRFNEKNNKEIEVSSNELDKNKTGGRKRKIVYKNFKKGEKVMFLNHIKNYLRWIPATVIKQVSPVTYVISIANRSRYCHPKFDKKIEFT